VVTISCSELFTEVHSQSIICFSPGKTILVYLWFSHGSFNLLCGSSLVSFLAASLVMGHQTGHMERPGSVAGYVEAMESDRPRFE
jgi:hypothetical protein